MFIAKFINPGLKRESSAPERRVHVRNEPERKRPGLGRGSPGLARWSRGPGADHVVIVLEAMVLVSAEHPGVGAEGRAGGHHVTEVAGVRERRRGPAEVRGAGGVGGARLGLGGLPVVQVCAGRRFRRFWRALVRREDGERLLGPGGRDAPFRHCGEQQALGKSASVTQRLLQYRAFPSSFTEITGEITRQRQSSSSQSGLVVQML